MNLKPQKLENKKITQEVEKNYMNISKCSIFEILTHCEHLEKQFRGSGKIKIYLNLRKLRCFVICVVKTLL